VLKAIQHSYQENLETKQCHTSSDRWKMLPRGGVSLNYDL
jgi:hypothetical protein